MNRARTHGMTLIELTVVILILSIIASIALSVYTSYAQRARFTAARVTIRELDVSCRRYQVDLDQFPPSYSASSFSTLNPTAAFTLRNVLGCGNMIEALTQSMSGNASNPQNDSRWIGPYFSVRQDQLGDYFTGGGPIGSGTLPNDVCLLDPWGLPYTYVRYNDYDLPGTDRDATVVVDSPFAGNVTTPAFYNAKGIQIYSVGPNHGTLLAPLHGLDGLDDINNFNTQ